MPKKYNRCAGYPSDPVCRNRCAVFGQDAQIKKISVRMKKDVDNPGTACYYMGVNDNHSQIITAPERMVPMEPRSKHFRKRDAILNYLRHTTEHPSAETVYAALKAEIPDLSLGTVYRNLSLFKEQGLIISLGSVNGVERYDGNINPHVHFICSGCEAVLDLEEMEIPAALKEAATACCGGSVNSCQLSFTGLCSECIRKEQGEAV